MGVQHWLAHEDPCRGVGVRDSSQVNLTQELWRLSFMLGPRCLCNGAQGGEPGQSVLGEQRDLMREEGIQPGLPAVGAPGRVSNLRRR